MCNYIFRSTLLLILLCFQLFVLITQFSTVSANSSLTSCPRQAAITLSLEGRWGKMANLATVYSKEAWCQSFLACYSFSLKSPIKSLKLRIKNGTSFLLILCRLHWMFYWSAICTKLNFLHCWNWNSKIHCTTKKPKSP